MRPAHGAPWDLLVVGGGTAGIVGAKTAAGFGARVLLVERERTGGDCLWTGCVPSKALLAAAGVAATVRDGARYGVHAGRPRVDFAAVMEHVRGAIRTIAPVDSPEALEEAGVTVWTGDLTFTGSQTARVGDREIRFDQALVCTGSAPQLPPVPGLESCDPLTSDTVWDLEQLPGRLAVLGGGAIGCELGQAFARLGAEVVVVEAADRLVPTEDPAASGVVEAALGRDGVRVLTGSKVEEVKAERAGAGHLLLEGGDSVSFDRLLVATGRTPRTDDLGLAVAGVRADERGHVEVDDHLRTSHPRIWAAGDVTGHPQFTHLAGVHGSLAASNAVLGLRRSIDLATNPRVTYTQPEVAAVGVATERAERADDLSVVTWEHAEVDRAVAEGETGGFTRMVLDRRGRILGATVVGPRAGETVGELTLAVRHGMRTRDLAGTTHPYPTWNDGLWRAAVADVRSRLRQGAPERVTRALVAARRRWVGSRAAAAAGQDSAR
ncbi:dihydrolipoyl dehydrogenase family protein [Nocardioides coralli]|uniref:dihydrolipoyl dehydrogenase family protein n=1 Tax=Nocardioides coralli TaxID=2872154 RepID=UPI001CA40CAF|nr:FAD-dependent oxidoreductase [Nocardioides coralli]QZY30127.1 FAD-dependent oxidoreductase [Nocardioides coralli]